jgi:hypothetical protein
MEANVGFSEEWNKLLARFRVESPLHMTDFVKPYGKYSGIYPEIKKALFREAVAVLNKYKLYSLSVSVDSKSYDTALTPDVRRQLIGPYAMCFFVTVSVNASFSSLSRYYAAHPISYLVDNGFGHSEQLVKAHQAIVDSNSTINKSVGFFAFDTDDKVPALQAADMIAWSARRRQLARLTEEFSPLEGIFVDQNDLDGPSWRSHFDHVISEDAIKDIAYPIMNWLALGIMPSLGDIVR